MKRLIVGFTLLLSMNAAAALAQTKPVSVAGKVTDHDHHPIAHAEVILREPGVNKAFHNKTDGGGHFLIEHPPGGSCELQVVPPLKSGFAQSLLTDIPGDEDRHVLVSVKPGFRVSGRVVCAGEPLKGVLVRVLDQQADTVHGGGQAVTDGHGNFSLIVTPGRKTVEVVNNNHEQAAGLYKETCNVIADEALPVLNVPANNAIGSAK